MRTAPPIVRTGSVFFVALTSLLVGVVGASQVPATKARAGHETVLSKTESGDRDRERALGELPKGL